MSPLFDPLTDINKERMNKNLTAMCEEMHEGFVQHVESSRDRKIKIPKEERKEKLYQGGIWTGKEGVELGYFSFLFFPIYLFLVLLMALELSKKSWQEISLMPNWLKLLLLLLLKDSEKEFPLLKIKSLLLMNKAFCNKLLKTFQSKNKSSFYQIKLCHEYIQIFYNMIHQVTKILIHN